MATIARDVIIVDDIRKLGNLSACSFASLEKSSSRSVNS